MPVWSEVTFEVSWAGSLGPSRTGISAWDNGEFEAPVISRAISSSLQDNANRQQHLLVLLR